MTVPELLPWFFLVGQSRARELFKVIVLDGVIKLSVDQVLIRPANGSWPAACRKQQHGQPIKSEEKNNNIAVITGGGNAGLYRNVFVQIPVIFIALVILNCCAAHFKSGSEEDLVSVQKALSQKHSQKPKTQEDPLKSATAFYNSGISLVEAKEYEEAIKAFSKTIEIFPEHWLAYSQRAWCYFSLGNFEKAISDYKIVAELNPEDDSSYYYLGLAHEYLLNHEDAIRSFNQAILLNPEEGAYYSALADSYKGAGDNERAMECYNKALKLNPEAAGFHYYKRGILNKDVEHYKEALSDFQKAIELGFAIGAAYFLRGNLYEKLGNDRKAIRDYQASARQAYPPAIDHLQSKGIAPDRLGYAIYMFTKVWSLLTDSQNNWIQGTRETKQHTMELYGETLIRAYEIGKGVYIAKNYSENCKELIKNWDVKGYKLKNIKALLMKSITYRLRSINLYIETLNSYPKPGLNVDSKMNEVKALAIVSSKYLLDAIGAYKAFLYSEWKGEDSVYEHIKNVNEFYYTLKNSITSMTSPFKVVLPGLFVD